MAVAALVGAPVFATSCPALLSACPHWLAVVSIAGCSSRVCVSLGFYFFMALGLPVSAPDSVFIYSWTAWLCPACFVGGTVGVVAVAGSRDLPASGSALVVRVASHFAANGASFVVGCCSGADAALLSAVPGSVPPSLVRCLAAFGPEGVGACSASATKAVFSFAGSGGSVTWWAGGAASVPLRVRLANRTRAVIASADAGLLVFFSSPSSRGSVLACRCAVKKGLPVLAFPVGFSGQKLPNLGAGSWVKTGQFGGFQWVKNNDK